MELWEMDLEVELDAEMWLAAFESAGEMLTCK